MQTVPVGNIYKPRQTWGHPRKKTRNSKEDEYGNHIVAMTWGIMVGKHGGNEQPTKSELLNGNIQRENNPHFETIGVELLYKNEGWSIIGCIHTLNDNDNLSINTANL